MDVLTLSGFSLRYGGSPSIISIAITPRLHISTFGPYCFLQHKTSCPVSTISVLPTVHAVTTSFATKLVLFLWQIRREGLSYKFFKKMIRPDSCIHHLIPEKRHESILSRLRNLSQYSISLARTERFKRSFVLYALHSFPTDISEDFCDDLIDS